MYALASFSRSVLAGTGVEATADMLSGMFTPAIPREELCGSRARIMFWENPDRFDVVVAAFLG